MKELLHAIFCEKIKLPEDSVELDALRMALFETLDTLKPEERKVILLRYGLFGRTPANGRQAEDTHQIPTGGMQLGDVAKRIRSRCSRAPKRGKRIIREKVLHWQTGRYGWRTITYTPTITRERVRQIEAKALRKLRHRTRLLRPFLHLHFEHP